MSIHLRLPSGETAAVDRALTVGRLPEADVTIPDPLVSGSHFEVGPAPGGAQIADLGSSNGTFVNGERLHAPRVLTGGEEISIGSQRIGVIRIAETAPVDLSLTVRVGSDSGKSVRLPDEGEVIIGRAEDADLRLADPLVSVRHCSVSLKAPPPGPCPHCATVAKGGDAHCVGCGRRRVGAEVVDLESANGVLVDGKSLPKGGRAEIGDGGEIQVGETVIVFGGGDDPIHVGPAPTVIRTVPAELRESADSEPVAATKRSRRSRLLAGAGIGGAAILALVAIVFLTGRDNSTIQDVIEEQSPRTVQVRTTYGGGGASTGSGIIVDADEGLILTNSHVIAGANDVAVRLPGGQKSIAATVVGVMPCEDLAMLRIDAAITRSLGSARIATAGDIRVGEDVVALGFPGTAEGASTAADFGADQLSPTEGIVSKIDAEYILASSGVAPLENTIQHTAAINPGNSGGPLFDLDGNVIGINTALFVDDYGQRLEGVNYAISAVRVRELLDRLRAGAVPGEFGMDIVPVWEKGKEDQGPQALEVMAVAQGGPAAQGGVKTGWYIEQIDGRPATDFVAFCEIVADGDSHRFTLFDGRSSERRNITLTPRLPS